MVLVVSCLLFDCFIVPTEDACCYCLTVILLNFDSYSEIYFGVKILPILVRGKQNLQWLKCTMVTTGWSALLVTLLGASFL